MIPAGLTIRRGALPDAAVCGCRIVGHGVEKGAEMFCCAHCAEHAAAH